LTEGERLAEAGHYRFNAELERSALADRTSYCRHFVLVAAS